jgi:hypothetical protein
LVAAEKVVAHQTPNYCPNREMDDEPAMPKLSAHSESSFSHFAKDSLCLRLTLESCPGHGAFVRMPLSQATKRSHNSDLGMTSTSARIRASR